MFTGLIKTTGEIRRVEQKGDRVIAVAMREPFAAALGDSIAVNGICLTVTHLAGNMFEASMSAATLACTTAGQWAVGTRVNLEPSLRVGDAVGGHFVSGHVDGIAKVTRSEKSGDSTIWEFEVPHALAKFIAPKGSITIDGVSLTVNSVKDLQVSESGLRSALREPRAEGVSGKAAKGVMPPSGTIFTVNIIPHTAEVTCFKGLTVGQQMNIEIDMLARYAARLKECI
jgi:riboflavin synthase